MHQSKPSRAQSATDIPCVACIEQNGLSASEPPHAKLSPSNAQWPVERYVLTIYGPLWGTYRCQQRGCFFVRQHPSKAPRARWARAPTPRS
jgi:hypothetical protein